MIVADSSVLAAYILREEPVWEAIEKLILKNDVYTLDLAIKEALNAVWKHAVLTRTLSSKVAKGKMSALLYLVESNAITVESQAGYLEEAFEIAITSRVTVYDALFIAQAKAKNAPLATLDDLQASVAKRLGVSVVKPHLP